MSNTTVETLRANLLTTLWSIHDPSEIDLRGIRCEDYITSYFDNYGTWIFDPRSYDKQIEEKRKQYLLLYRFATEVVIARDYGIEAATLYKLSGGNIDPRKGGDA